MADVKRLVIGKVYHTVDTRPPFVSVRVVPKALTDNGLNALDNGTWWPDTQLREGPPPAESPQPKAQGDGWIPFDIRDENSNWPPEGEQVALMTRGKCMFLGRLVWDAETDPQLDDDGLGYSIEDLTHWALHRFPEPPEVP